CCYSGGITQDALLTVPYGGTVSRAWCGAAAQRPQNGGGNSMHVLDGTLNTTLVLALLPLLLIDLGMVIYWIVDLYRPERRVRGSNKTVWLLIILLISTIGWLAYLLAGRED